MRSALQIALCMIGVIISSGGHAETMGRLFYTPQQRAQLDYNFARLARPDDDSGNALTLNGIVQRHGGKRTAWINGAPQQVGTSDERTPESVAVAVPGQNRSVKLKVGQRVLLNPTATPETARQGALTPAPAKPHAADEEED